MSRTTTRRAFALEVAGLYTMGAGTLAFAQTSVPPGRSVTPTEEKANAAVVSEFFAAFNRHDLPRIIALLADNCSFRVTQTRPPVQGKDAIAATIKGFLDSVVDFKVLKSSVVGPLVVNERDDILKSAQGTRTFHVTGMFFVDKGKIVEWTDYLVE